MRDHVGLSLNLGYNTLLQNISNFSWKDAFISSHCMKRVEISAFCHREESNRKTRTCAHMLIHSIKHVTLMLSCSLTDYNAVYSQGASVRAAGNPELSGRIEVPSNRKRSRGALTRGDPYCAQTCLAPTVQFVWLVRALCTVLEHSTHPCPRHGRKRCTSARYSSRLHTSTLTQCWHDLLPTRPFFSALI